ncbi:type IX secretion system outer membrane channel protein PorV [Crocinitomix algicola]|uniref:type IX secretion system outer membrane channel protein PorV n=1 Tax=Crocinitomix algicola TaxID=1740263 RepID=UPI000833A698|nr:type IX secretion system outer membrane channel protein PorV [Crocinitomix algicola]
MKKSIAYIASLLFVTGVNAQNVSKDGDEFPIQLNTITTAVPFAIIAPDSRASAIGDAGAATSADANSFHWNTAKLAFSKEKAEFGVSYSPWLKQLVDDIHLSYISGYTKVGKNHTFGGSMRYFSLGNITFTDNQGNLIREFSPNEFEILGGYAFQMSDRSAIGFNGKFIYSNLTGGVNSGNTATKAGLAGAVDLSYSYVNEDVDVADYDAVFSWGATISNIGNKMSYTDEADRDFLPTNLRLGSAMKFIFDDYNSLTTTVDFNKLLVPTLPRRNGDGEILSGYENNVGVTLGMLQSFYDAPGNVIEDDNGDFEVQSGSRLKEELNEINIGGGLEYWYGDVLALRGGYFYEHRAKGNRKYFTFGAGLYYSVFGIDVSYLAALRRNNPLSNTVRFSLKFKFGNNKLNNAAGE